jgi:hypothetical protein
VVKRRAVLLLGVAAVAGCGGTHTTKPANTGSRNVTKPFERPIVVSLKGSPSGTAQLRRLVNKQTSVSLKLSHVAGKGLTASLERGSCGAAKGLRVAKPLGAVRQRSESWSVTASLTQLTASPLALVLRRAGKVVACGTVRQA